MSDYISITLHRIDFPEGRPAVHNYEDVQIQVSTISGFEVSSFVCKDSDVNDHDLTLTFRNGADPVSTRQNGIEVLRKIAEAAQDGLAGKFVDVTDYEHQHDGCGYWGWAAGGDAERLAIPDFLERHAA